jgi:pyruvate dehydrogenase E1 component alpha subunit
MMAELMGRVTGYCQGKGGSMHLADMTHNVVGANGVVGAGGPMMIGVALTQKFRDSGRVAVVYYGDGASNQGNIFEAMNLAQLWKLPVLFVCEDNGYAESTPKWQQVPVEDLAVRGQAFGMKTLSVDGNDVRAVIDAATEACEYARSGKGPVYLVARTWRFEGHYVGDAEVYRPKGEAKEWRAKDPIPAFVKVMLDAGISQGDIDAITAEVDEVCETAVAEARAAELPAPEDAMQHVYAEFPYDGPVRGV